jgi:selenocysteine lyase/cysteine desulfurase
LGKALLLLRRIGLDVIQEEESELTARLLRGLSSLPRVTVHGIRDPQSPQFAHKGGVVIFDVKNTLPATVAETLAVQGGIGVRSGCHCAHLLVKHILHIPAPLEQFQGALLRVLPKLSLPGVVRISLGIENSAEDIDALLAALAGMGEGPKVDASGILDGFAAGVVQEVYGTLPKLRKV